MVGRVLAQLVVLLALVVPPAARPDVLSAAEIDATALALINQERARVGVAPLALHPALSRAATNHVEYYRANFGDPQLAGMGLHREQPDRPGFTGVEPEDRAAAAGYPSRRVNENAGLTGNLEASLRWHFATINHRLPLLDPRYTHVGLGAISEGRIKFDVVLLGAPSWPASASPAWVAWPPDGAGDIGLSFNGESPSPFPGQRYPTGYPITLSYHGPGTVSFTGASLRAEHGEALPVVFRQGSGWHSRRSALVAAVAPLARGTTYVVAVNGTVDGAAFTRQWRFTTLGATSPPRAIEQPVATPEPPATATPPAATPTPSRERQTSSRGGRTEPTPTPASTTLPPGVAGADAAVADLWQRSDGHLTAGSSQQTWLWGPDAFDGRLEPYAEAGGGLRQVYYFDKSRMEITDPWAERGVWYVTNGLLVRELVAGQIQVGHAAAAPAGPAESPVVGDAADNPNAPSYADFRPLASLTPGDYRAEARVGQPVTATLRPDGSVGSDRGLGRHATIAAYSAELGHNIPDVFWTSMSELAEPWVYVLGLPLTEAYWVRATVGGVERDVLVQLFERRVLTFTPDNAPAWRVEMGNVGRHYYRWRYGA